MSLLLLVDGYNVVAPVAPPRGRPDPRWLERERMRLIARLAEHLDEPIRRRTCVVFDAADPPPGRPHRFTQRGIDVRFAVGYPEADDLLEELIAAHSAPKNLAVVSSDQRVQAAARRRGSRAFDAQEWLDALLDGVPRLAVDGRHGAGQGSGSESSDKPQPSSDEDDVQSWMREFGM
jgi:predicted RNA-binding protein with PIN domain